MLKQKIGQMLIMGFNGMELHADDSIVHAISAQQIGGVILFDYDFQTQTFLHNIKNPQQVRQLTQQLQSYARHAPLFISIDYEGGKVNRLKESNGFPPTLSAAEIGRHSLSEVERYAIKMAETLQQLGINMNFAPVLDVNVNPDNPVIGKLGRSFSPNPKKVIEYAALFTKAYQAQGVLPVYKHFPGHGSSRGDTHIGCVDVTETWEEYELEPYKQLLPHFSQGLVMTAHVVHAGLDDQAYPASLSFAITTGLLREQLHYQGVVVTDDMQMKAITDHYGLAKAIRLAINAGADILVFGNQLVARPQDPQQLVEMIYADVQQGHISESRIDEAYQRIMKLKAVLSLRKLGNEFP